MEIRRAFYGLLVQKPNINRPLGTPTRNLEGSIKMHFKEIYCKGVDLIDLSQEWDKWRAVVNRVMDLGVP
jgi:hypothetical protein